MVSDERGTVIMQGGLMQKQFQRLLLHRICDYRYAVGKKEIVLYDSCRQEYEFLGLEDILSVV